MNKSALTLPKLRFKGFDGEWERKKVKEISKFTRGKKPKPLENYVSKNFTIPWIKISDIKEKYLYKTESFFNQHFPNLTLIVKENSLLYTIEGSPCIPFFVKMISAIDNHIALIDIENKEINLDFFYYFLLKNKKNFEKFITGSTLLSISIPDISIFPISLPSLPEQQKIAHFFSLLDKQIQLWERKLELYELKKKYFVKEQVSIYTTKYKKERIKNFFDLIIGSSLENSVKEDGKFYLIDLSSINLKNQLIKNFKKTNDSLNILKIGDIVIIMSDVSHKQLIGRSAIITENNLFSLNQRVGALRKNKIVSENFSKFISIILNAERKYFYNIAQGSSQTNISNKNILDFSFPLPSVNVIESFVRTIIQLENYELFLNNKITLLKKRKKFYINKLFM